MSTLFQLESTEHGYTVQYLTGATYGNGEPVRLALAEVFPDLTGRYVIGIDKARGGYVTAEVLRSLADLADTLSGEAE